MPSFHMPVWPRPGHAGKTSCPTWCPLGTLDPWSLKQKSVRKRLFWHLGVKRMLTGAAAIHYTSAEEKRLVETGLGLSGGVVVPNGSI